MMGWGCKWNNFVYHFPSSHTIAELNLEMVNIVLAFVRVWIGTQTLVRCDNDTVFKVLNAGKARDPFLGACACNIWYQICNIGMYWEESIQLLTYCPGGCILRIMLYN